MNNFIINKLMESDVDKLRELAWFLYHRNIGSRPLTKEDLESVLEMIADINIEEDIEKAREAGYEDGYDAGFNDGYREGFYDTE